MTTESSYPPIAEHGLIGDLQTTALVDTAGTVDFFCCPRVDSPTVFGALLDHDKGGQFSVRARADDVVTKQMYLPDTAVLVTRYLAESGVAELADFMPIDQPGVASDRRRLIRVIRGVRGSLSFDVRVAPRFDYGRQTHLTKVEANHAVFSTDDLVLDLSATVALDDHDGDVWAEVTVAAGEFACFVIESGAEGSPTEIGHGDILRLFDDTRAFWHNWVEGGTYRGRWREMVYRSAITLKLLTYAPAGSIVAASTGGLPEQVGGERNWDYRYTWVRDGSFSVRALLALGFRDEAIAFSMWMRDRAETKREDGSTPLDIMYRVDGSSDLVEETLDHFDGYRGSRPVRIGNGAAEQLQLDIYGEFLDSLYLLDQAGLMIGDAGWTDVAEIIDWLCDNWDQPDEGRVGDTRRAEGVRLRAAHVLGGVRPSHQDRQEPLLPGVARPLDDRAGPDLPRHPRQGMERGAAGLRPVRGQRCARRVDPAHAPDGVHLSHGSEVGLHVAGDGPDPRVRQPGVPL